MCAKRTKFKIKEDTKPKKNITEDNKPEQNTKNKIIINFSCPFSLYSCCIKNQYTNFLPNHSEFVKMRRLIFGEALEYFNQHAFEQLVTNKTSHTHKIPEDKLALVERILTELIKKKWPYKNIDNIVGNYMCEDIWQLGFNGGIRFIGIRKDNVLNLLFIDYHHLIEPSQKYNQKDHFKYNYCAMTTE